MQNFTEQSSAAILKTKNMYLNKETNASYGFVAPKISEDENKKVEEVFPTSEKKDVTLSSNAAEVTVKRTLTIVDLGNDNLAAGATLTLEPDSKLPMGAKVYVKWKNGSTKYDVTIKQDSSTTVGTGVGVASTTVTKEVIWTGSSWLIVG